MNDPVPLNAPESVRFDRVVLSHRIVQIGMLVGLVWKWTYFVESARIYQLIPLADEFFPTLLRSATLVIAAFLVGVASIGLTR